MLYPVGLHAAVWFAPGAELPQGSLMSSAPQIKTQHSQYSQYSQSAPPAAAQQTATAMQNFGAKNYPRAFRGLSGGQPVPLTGRATHPTATRLFLPSFFSPGKKAEGQRRNRYSLFFAKLFFLPKKKRNIGVGGGEILAELIGIDGDVGADGAGTDADVII